MLPAAQRISPKAAPALRRAATVAHFLDAAFTVPGTKFRFGLDAIIGIIPGIGDLIGGLLSLYIIAV